MDFIDLWWNLEQHAAITELRSRLKAESARGVTTIVRQTELIRLMQQENDELRLRVGVLIRLLIQQGAISADQYSAAVNEAKASIAVAQPFTIPRRAATPRPKPPKLNPPKPK